VSHDVFTLVGPDGRPQRSSTPGSVGGHRRSKIFGRLDCPSALRAIARGGYVDGRVFFRDAETALRAGYRPCAVCMREEYRSWKAALQRPSRRT
jgi:methylphosphotriester-DNA--protein-cysteine methyltransferase